MDYDQATAQQKQTEANVGEIRAMIQRKTIRAPFSGILGIRKVNLGQYLSAGGAVVQLQSLNPIYVDFGLPQQALTTVQVGRELAGYVRRSRGQGIHRKGHGSGFGDRPDHAKRSGAGYAFQSRGQIAARHVRSGRGGIGHRAVL